MKALLLGTLTILIQAALGQENIDTVPYPEAATGFDARKIETAITKRKPMLSLEFGTVFGAGSRGSYFGTFVSPGITYPLSNRFTVGAGGYFSGISPTGMQGDRAVHPAVPFGRLHSWSYLYVSGAYRLTNDLTVTGTAYKEINPFGHGSGYSQDAHGVIMGIDYRISDHVFIRGELEVRQGYSPFHGDPFMNPGRQGIHDPFFLAP